MILKLPPDYLDGAKVLKWAWSGEKPFGNIGPNEEDLVFGLAVCHYDPDGAIYRFSCDKNWEVVQDSIYNSVDDAINQLPSQYKNVPAKWNSI